MEGEEGDVHINNRKSNGKKKKRDQNGETKFK